MLYIYLHGFNSAFDPSSPKIQALASLGEVTGITYDSFATYDEIFQEISNRVPDRDDLVFVGTSLGGFWAAEMARKFGTASVIINPCYTPHIMLWKYVGVPQTNYHTNETKTLTLETTNTYPLIGMSKYYFRFRPLVLLDMEDEVIDSKESLKFFDGFPLKAWEGGNHRFEHMTEALTTISDYVNICSFVEHMDAY
jgi:uncharacterized protein